MQVRLVLEPPVAALAARVATQADLDRISRCLERGGASLKRRTSTPERRRCYHGEHTAIVDALRDRDPDGAHAAMRRHLENVADNLLGRH
ncbi:FadR family transcriptional regulator [Micromonospora sp. ATA32]|nr:FadR family transcriptional regulator [Micromonospora sp. ATA32]